VSAASAKIFPQEQARRLRALVVDDSPAALAAVCVYVEKGQQFLVAETAMDGCEALQLARNCAPDLVVIDFELPKLNGIDAAQVLLSEFPSLPIVVVSMFDTSELRQVCEQVGVRAFVPKQQLGQELPALLKEIHRLLTT
jgi:DNA-binding NarL/FixJ family response regulator